MPALPTADVAHATHATLVIAAYDGSPIDGRWYSSITGWARGAPGWLDTAVTYWSTYGIVVFAVLMVLAWWAARRQPAMVMARTLASPVAVLAAYLLNEVLKAQVQEVRPCRDIPHSFTLEACPAPTDWAFPSNHTVVAFAAAAALLLANRKLGSVALLAAAAMGASRVYVGAHYPHDVIVGAVVGLLVGVAVTLLAARLATSLVERVRARGGWLGPFLVAAQGLDVTA